MPLNPSIPLQGIVPSVKQGLDIFDRERGYQDQHQFRNKQLDQNQQRLDLLGQNQESRKVQSQAQQALRDEQLRGLKNKNTADEEVRKRRSMAVGALQLQSLSSPATQEKYLKDRIQRIELEGGDATESKEELDSLRADPEKFNEDISKAVEFSYSSGILKTPQQKPSSVQEFKYYESLTPQQKTTFRDLKRRNEGININPVTGMAEAVEGFADVKKEIKKAEETGKLEAKKELEPSIAKAIEIAKNVGKAEGIQINELNDRISVQPRLLKVVDELASLGKKATFTFTGRASDAARRELGLPVGQGAVARTEYISKVDNEILPLLRQTFGAQFTEKEGESLKNTLGDPNKSPVEKEAVLKSFIAAKIGTIETLKRRTGQYSEVEQSKNQSSQGLEDDPLNLFDK